MRNHWKHLIAIAAICTLFAPAFAWATQEASQQQDQQVQGQLVHVNPDAMILVVQDSDGNKTQIQYTQQTEVVGADNTVAGLDSAAGSNVAVTYHVENSKNIATRIEIQSQS